MNWLRVYFNRLFSKTKYHQPDSEYKLILFVCVPCFLVSGIALFMAQISAYLIAFILIILFLLCCYVVADNRRNAEYQIRTLSNLIESMIDGDYTLRGRLQKNQAFQELLNLVNNLADTLSIHKIEAKESRILLERIMEQMDAMVLATDDDGFVVMANASANKIILEGVEHLTNIKLSASTLGAQIKNAESDIIEFSAAHLSGEHFLSKEPFLTEGKQHTLYILTNAERLLMEKERKAWQSLLRVLSHEMNNSLTPIATISQSIQKMLQKPQAELNKTSLLDGVNIINERANSLSLFISSYSQLSYLPDPNKSLFELETILNSTAILFPEGEISISESCNVIVEADKHQFEQIIINLFKNAIEAMAQNTRKAISVTCYQQDKWQHISIVDHGVGIANIDNVFVPFYTTKEKGNGIGLALCKQILFNHGGSIKLSNTNNHKGVEVLLSLPKAS